MKILVTGGAGFIGSHTVVELHNAGFQPVIIDNLANASRSVLAGLRNITGIDFPFYEADCNDYAAVSELFRKEGDIRAVIHFAADKAVGESVAKPRKYYRNNIGSLLTMLDVMAENGCGNIVFSSSCTVYGQPDQLPVTEDSPVRPAESPYGNTKQVCEEILRDTVKSGADLRAVALRYFNPIGAHPSAEIGELPIGVPGNLVPFITQTAIGMRESLSIFGSDYDTVDGTCVRDYIHVVDLARAHVQAINLLNQQGAAPWYDFINLGTGEGSSVLQVVQTFERVSGKPLNYKIVDRRAGDVEKIYAQIGKSKTMLEWETKLSLEDGLRDAWRWQQKLEGAKQAEALGC
ncbi:MAG: UDP-glucose 4-epimerase GalE [Bacteroidota bacterium]